VLCKRNLSNKCSIKVSSKIRNFTMRIECKKYLKIRMRLVILKVDILKNFF